jgi:hypothetical protein
VKCIAWNFDESNFVKRNENPNLSFEKDEDLKKLRFENGDLF